MTFQRAEPNREYGALRFLSTEGRWEIGLNPYHNGIRLRMGLAGRPPSVIDFCLGHHREIYSPALFAVMERLESLPESVSKKEIDAVFPWAGTRPDPTLHLPVLLGKSLSELGMCG